MINGLLFTLLAMMPQQTSALESEKSSKDEAKFTPSGHVLDSIDLVKKRLKANEAVLIDVREVAEWEQGHLQDAKLVPMSVVRSNKLTKEMKKSLPKDKPIYCHCLSGGRVLVVSKILREQGFDIRPLHLGYKKMLAAGFKKAEPEKKP